MKTISTALTAHLGGETTTLAQLIKITRRDGVIKTLTDHDQDLVVDGLTYRADGAFDFTSLTTDSDLEAEADPVSGLLDSSQISEADLRAGRYDQARIDVYLCNWADPMQGVLQLRRGWLGEVTLRDGQYQASLRSLHDLLEREVGDVYTPECRYDFGDSRCSVVLAGYTVTGTVSLPINETQFADSSRAEPDGVFAYGKLTWTSGANQGLAADVRSWEAASQTLSLWLPAPNPISLGDSYQLQRGCDKRFSTCSGVFNNAVNFGGFPHLPGINKILQYPDRT
jgi:uncharacterized phage protein (TIGR02218 family)